MLPKGSALNEARLHRAADYDMHRHVLLMIAILAEMRAAVADAPVPVRAGARIGAAMLRKMGFGEVRLLTNNPAKVRELVEHGIDVVETVPLIAGRTAQNASYLRTKRDRMHHHLTHLNPGETS